MNSDYTRPSHDTMHTLMFYLNTEYGSRFDADVGLGTLVAMVSRLAMRMGCELPCSMLAQHTHPFRSS